jgi:hypothetical protein
VLSEGSLNRRTFLSASGVALVGTAFIGPKVFGETDIVSDGEFETMADLCGNVVAREKLLKPVYLAPENSTDPVTHSIAENLFWNDIMMEHAQFFIMLMPGAELANYRAQAQRFERQFAAQLRRTCQLRITRANLSAFNQSTIALVRPFITFKRRLTELQSSGKLKSLVWPSFFQHTADEAEYFVKHLQSLSQGEVRLPLRQTADFWVDTMADHGDFIAHLLDPSERELVAKAYAASAAMRSMQRSTSRSALLKAGEEIIAFKTAAEKGIIAGQIMSIIHPNLADHVRREAVKFVDELKRSV